MVTTLGVTMGTWEQGYFTTSFPHGQMDTFNGLPKVAFSSELFYALTTSTSTIIPIPSWEENKVETNREPNRKSQSRFILEYWTWQNCSQILRWTRCTPALHYVSLISLGTLYCIDGSIISRWCIWVRTPDLDSDHQPPVIFHTWYILYS